MSQHRGLVGKIAHSGTLLEFCPAQNSIRRGEGPYWWMGGLGLIFSLKRVSSFQTTRFWSLDILVYFYWPEGWGLRFLLPFSGSGPGSLEIDPAVQMYIQGLVFAHSEAEGPSPHFLCSL